MAVDKAVLLMFWIAEQEKPPAVLEFISSILSPRDGGGGMQTEDMLEVSQMVKHSGVLKVQVEASSYTSTALRDAMIKAAASVANVSSTQPDACKMHKFEEKGATDLKQVVCQVTEFAGVHYFDGTPDRVNDMSLDAIWHSDQSAKTSEILCEAMMEVIDMVLIEIAPEFGVGDTMIEDYIHSECMESLS